MKKRKNLYSIGQASKKTDVSPRTLRYYESVGLIEPDFVKDNGYRYYSEETILVMSIIKYLQFMDFSLDEIKRFISKADYDNVNQIFNELISKTEDDLTKLNDRLIIIKDWNELIAEASTALLIHNNTPSIKYMNRKELVKYPIDFDYDYEKQILDLDFANFIKDNDNIITGAVMFYFPSYKDRIKYEAVNRNVNGFYIQNTVRKIKNKDIVFCLSPGFYASIYHFGGYSNIRDSYERLIQWSKENCYKLHNQSIERFVVDTWTLREEDKYVTEILIPINRKVE